MLAAATAWFVRLALRSSLACRSPLLSDGIVLSLTTGCATSAHAAVFCVVGFVASDTGKRSIPPCEFKTDDETAALGRRLHAQMDCAAPDTVPGGAILICKNDKGTIIWGCFSPSALCEANLASVR